MKEYCLRPSPSPTLFFIILYLDSYGHVRMYCHKGNWKRSCKNVGMGYIGKTFCNLGMNLIFVDSLVIYICHKCISKSIKCFLRSNTIYS